jgi:cytochrome c-type biogenesis protein
LASFGAGLLTAAAPCVLPLLPVIVGGSVIDGANKSLRRPLLIALGLALSVIVFTLLLKGTTALLGVPQFFWQAVSGGILLLLGVSYLIPAWWERVAILGQLQGRSQGLLQRSRVAPNSWGALATGAALGPVFNSCSPTYALIVAVVLPTDFLTGLGYVIAYATGLALALMMVSLFGRKLIQQLGWVSQPDGWFHRVIGVLLLAVGVLVLSGYDRVIQAYVLDQGWYQPVERLERQLRGDVF